MATTTKETYRADWRGRDVAISADFDDSNSIVEGLGGTVYYHGNSARMALRDALLRAAAADGLDPNTWETMEEVLTSLDAVFPRERL